MPKSILLSCFSLIAAPLLMAQPARQELLGLKTQYENAVDRAVAPLQDKYLAGLKALKEKYTRAGDLDSAILIDKELKSEGGRQNLDKKNLPNSEAELRDFLINYGWLSLGKDSKEFRFTADDRIMIIGDKNQPFFRVTGRRSVTMFWGGKMDAGGIPCTVSEDCLAITELSGYRVVWTRAPR